MNFKELALRRESCRDYDGRPVAHELLSEIVETACLSPSACNSQPWRLILAEGEVAEQLRPMMQVGGRNKFTENVPAFVAICETKAVLRPGVNENDQHFAQMDIGMATMMLTLAAADQGVASCILGCFDEAAVKSLLQIPEEIPLRLVVALGYAKADGPRPKVRKPADEVSGLQRW